MPPDLSLQEAAPLYQGNLQKLMVRDPAAIDELAMTLHMANMAKTRLRSRSVARRFVTAESLRDLHCRLNCIFGDGDVTLHPDLASIRAYIEDIDPAASFHVVPDTGHWVQYESPEAFNGVLLEMLKEGTDIARAAD